MDYFEFKRWCEEERAALKLPKDCTEQPPLFARVHFWSWDFEWSLIFSDNNYIRITERYREGSAPHESNRIAFTFHYGPLASRRPDGTPKWEPHDPVVIRIDNAHGPVHVHFGAQEPRLSQSQVDGLNLVNLEMFQFVKAVLKHRKTGKPLDKIMKFRIR